MSKSIFRKGYKSGYAQISNEMLEDGSLSWKAKGILAYLLSRPDNWQVFADNIKEMSKDGITSVYSGLDELIENHYLYKINVQGGWEYMVYDFRQEVDPYAAIRQQREESQLRKSQLRNPQLRISQLRKSETNNTKEENNTDSSVSNSNEFNTSADDLDLPDDDEVSFDDKISHPSKAKTQDLFTGVVVPISRGKTRNPRNSVPRRIIPNAPTSDDFISAWNGAIVLPQISAFSAGRQKEFRARCREQFFCDNWRQAIKNLCRSKFHLGSNDRNWRVTVDWFLKPDSVPKLIEQGMQKPKEEETFLNRSYRDDDKPFYEQ